MWLGEIRLIVIKRKINVEITDQDDMIYMKFQLKTCRIQFSFFKIFLRASSVQMLYFEASKIDTKMLVTLVHCFDSTVNVRYVFIARCDLARNVW